MSDYKENSKTQITDFTKYPREFITYKWYRPLLTLIAFWIIFILLANVLTISIAMVNGRAYTQTILSLAQGYDGFNVYSGPGALATLGTISVMIPALALANKLAGRRTFRSYESSRGGWNFGIFFKCLLIGLVIIAVPVFILQVVLYGKTGVNQFTLIGLIFCTVLGPIQCIAEEYLFRGLFLQGIGSWLRIPVAAIVIQSIIFAAMHPYNIIGVIDVLFTGIVLGLVAWISHGLEASSALHICNNMAVFYATGLGFGNISSDSDIPSMAASMILSVIFLAVVVVLRKRGMFDVRKADDAAEYNAKIEAKLAAKAS